MSAKTSYHRLFLPGPCRLQLDPIVDLFLEIQTYKSLFSGSLLFGILFRPYLRIARKAIDPSIFPFYQQPSLR
ncbi:hypothetical protein [Phaffia rhodozyma]|uniref:Uncharacterized protein n=1 Tax=Phaffia rhodozyma TaxID=264483 RepID=A0A0F7SJI5_PHARH|nr:hypothetical protein [Phaffia rhodozyma]